LLIYFQHNVLIVGSFVLIEGQQAYTIKVRQSLAVLLVVLAIERNKFLNTLQIG